jgi:hypothetical protein
MMINTEEASQQCNTYIIVNIYWQDCFNSASEWSICLIILNNRKPELTYKTNSITFWSSSSQLLSVMKNDHDNIKARVWHMILSMILKCKFTLLLYSICSSLLTTCSNWIHCKRKTLYSICWQSWLTMSFCNCWLHDELWETDVNYEC